MSSKQKATVRRAADRLGALAARYAIRNWWLNKRSEQGSSDLPPPNLRTLVAGVPDSGWLVECGRLSAAALAEAAAAAGFDINDPTLEILDFGCGCGRTSRHWQRPVHGTDINPKLVEWCQQHLPGDYSVNQPEPPTVYTDGEFDLVYAVSVFTHLAVDRQKQWMREFARIIRPGGLLILTTHGDNPAATALTDDQLRDYRQGRIVVCYPRQDGRNLCAAYHPAGALVQLTDEFVLLERRLEQIDRQDANVLKRL